MTRWIVLVALLVAAGGVAWFRFGRDPASVPPATVPLSEGTGPKSSASDETRAPAPVPTLTDHPAADVAAQRTARSEAFVDRVAAELELTDTERTEVAAALKELEDGRRELFVALEARQTSPEMVSRDLKVLRARMLQRVGTRLGEARGKRFSELLRMDAGYEAAPEVAPE